MFKYECACEHGEDCTRTTMCAVQSAVNEATCELEAKSQSTLCEACRALYYKQTAELEAKLQDALNRPEFVLYQMFEDIEAKLSKLEYRHETLKMMYADEMNFSDDDVPVELAIDEFIAEEQSHS